MFPKTETFLGFSTLELVLTKSPGTVTIWVQSPIFFMEQLYDLGQTVFQFPRFENGGNDI